MFMHVYMLCIFLYTQNVNNIVANRTGEYHGKLIFALISNSVNFASKT